MQFVLSIQSGFCRRFIQTCTDCQNLIRYTALMMTTFQKSTGLCCFSIPWNSMKWDKFSNNAGFLKKIMLCTEKHIEVKIKDNYCSMMRERERESNRLTTKAVKTKAILQSMPTDTSAVTFHQNFLYVSLSWWIGTDGRSFNISQRPCLIPGNLNNTRMYVMIKEDYVWRLSSVKPNVNEPVMSSRRGCKVY